MNLNLFGKSIFAIYKHNIMKCNLSELRYSNNELFNLTLIPNDQYDTIINSGSTLSHTAIKKIAKNFPNQCEMFVMTDAHKNTIGSVCVMYCGGNDPEYRIRNINCYIFGVYINTQYRGHGFSGTMLGKTSQHLKSKGLDEAYLAVSQNNKSAIRAYEKLGFSKVATKAFIRICRVNIPYHKL